MLRKKMTKSSIKTFIENNFPPCSEYTILEESDTKAVILLDYGRREDKLKITIGYIGDDYSLFKLLQTDFIR